jgi:hypothetical protein
MPIKVQGGKNYNLVTERLVLFFDSEDYDGWSINTDLSHMDGVTVVMGTKIIDAHGAVRSTGHAHAAFGGDSFTDKVLEKAETCSVGRALAFLDKNLMGSEIASADELGVAIKGVPQKVVDERNFAFFQAYLRWRDKLDDIKDRLADADFAAAKELMEEIPNEEKLALNRAWTKGGCFTPTETKQIKWWSNDWDTNRKEG